MILRGKKMNEINLSEEKVQILRGVFDNASKLAEEVLFNIKEEKLEIQAREYSNIMVSNITIEKEFFKDYNIEDPQEIGLSLTDLKKVLKVCKGDVNIKISDLVKINSVDFNVKIPVYEITAERMKIPKIDFDYSFKIPTKMLKELLSDATILQNCTWVLLKETDEGISMNSGERSREATKEYKIEGKAENKDTTLKLNAEFFSKSLCKDFDDVIVSMKTDFPIKFEMKGVENIKYETYLAPMARE